MPPPLNPILIVFCQGSLRKIALSALLLHDGWLLQEVFEVWASALVGAPDQDQQRPAQVFVLLQRSFLGLGKWPIDGGQSDSVERTDWKPSSDRALQHLCLHPWDLLHGWSQLWEWWQASSCILVVDQLSLSVYCSSVAAAARACQWASLALVSSCSPKVSHLPQLQW